MIDRRHPGVVLLTTAIGRYLDENPDHLKAGGLRNHRWTLNRLGRSLGSDRALADVRQAELVDFVSFGEDGLRHAPNTTSNYRGVFQNFFAWCCDEDVAYLSSDPSLRLKKKVGKSRERVRMPRWLHLHEVEALMESCRDGVAVDRRDLVVLRLFVGTARRRAEVLRLRWRNINFAAQVITFETTKMGEPQFVSFEDNQPLGQTLFAWRSEYIKALGCTEAELAHLPVICKLKPMPLGIGMKNRSIGINWGRPLSTQSITLLLEVRAAKAGVGRFAAHDLRRTAAGLMEADGMTIAEIQEYLGHANPKTTELYLNGNPFKQARRRGSRALAI